MQTELDLFVCGGFYPRHPASVRGRPTVFFDLASALQFSRHHPGACEDQGVLGLWLHGDDVEELLWQERPFPPARRPLFQTMLQRQEPWRALPAASALGYEVLGFDLDRCVSWQREGLAEEAAAFLGLHGDPRERLTDFDAARAAAEYLNRADLGPPVIWRPWLLVAYRPFFSGGGGGGAGPSGS